VKYFTPDWWAGNVEDENVAIREYQQYIESIRPYLTPGMSTLHWDVSLHDSQLRDLFVNVENASLEMVLLGTVNPWSLSSAGWMPRRFALTYVGVRHVQIKEHESRLLFRPELGYHEIERLDNGTFEHRLLFGSGTELVIQFADLLLEYVDLKEPVA
jgi:hypothetical protein